MSDDYKMPTDEEVAALMKEAGIETVDQPQKEDQEVTKSEEVKEHSDVEKQALEMGWNPEGSKSAEEWVKNAPLFEKLHKQSNKIKNLEKKFNEAIKHIGSLRKAGYQNEYDKLKQARDDAIVMSDVESVNKFDDKLYDLKAKMDAEVKETSSSEATPEAQEFVDKYSTLFQDDSPQAVKIQNYVRAQDMAIAALEYEPKDHIKELEDRMLEKFPSYFGVKAEKAEKKERVVPIVESDATPTRPAKKDSTITFNDLTRVQKEICRALEADGVLTREQYLEQVQDGKGVQTYG